VIRGSEIQPKRKDKMTTSSFKNMKEIGALTGLSSHQVGRALTDMGLRAGSQPSAEAISQGLAKQQWYDDVGIYGWVWHVEKIGRHLDEAGLTQK